MNQTMDKGSESKLIKTQKLILPTKGLKKPSNNENNKSISRSFGLKRPSTVQNKYK